MHSKNYMLIKEFSYLTGIKKENLRFYDQIGLLSPEKRGENGYRYYSRRQLNTAYLIADLRDLGVGLEAIKTYANGRTPERMMELFAEQEKHIGKEIKRLKSIQDIMEIRIRMAKKALSHESGSVVIEEREEESIFICPPFPNEIGEEEGSLLAYEYASAHGLNLGYPLCAILSTKDVVQGEKPKLRQFYYKARKTYNEKKLLGKYAVAYGESNEWDSYEVLKNLLKFVEDNEIKVVSDFYVEFLLDEVAVQDVGRYYSCIQVRVE